MTNEHEIHHRIDRMEGTITNALSELTSAVKSLVQLETEHKATRDTLARYGNKLEQHEHDLETIKIELPLIKRFMARADKISLALTILIAGGIVGSFFVFNG